MRETFPSKSPSFKAVITLCDVGYLARSAQKLINNNGTTYLTRTKKEKRTSTNIAGL